LANVRITVIASVTRMILV